MDIDKLIVEFARWLDDNYTPAEFGDYRSRYEGACNMLRKAGFYVERSGAAVDLVKHTITVIKN